MQTIATVMPTSESRVRFRAQEQKVRFASRKKTSTSVKPCVHTSCGPSASAQPTGRCSELAGLHGAYDSSPAAFHPAAQSP